MPALTDPQHEEFARLIATGASKVDAYDQIFPGAERRAARDKGALLAQQPEVEERIIELLEEGAQEAVWSLADRLEHLRQIALTSHADLDHSSPVCAGIRWTDSGPEYKMPDKLAAVALYNKLSGDLDPASHDGPDLLGEVLWAVGHKTLDDPAPPRPGRVLSNARHERFAQLVAIGERLAYAYEKTYGIPRDAARTEGYRLSQQPEVAERIATLRQAGAALVGWTRAMRLRYLRDLVEMPIGDIDITSPYCQGVRRTRYGSNLKIPNKIRAIALYSQLAHPRQAPHPRTIEGIVEGMRSRGNHGCAKLTENSLIAYVTRP